MLISSDISYAECETSRRQELKTGAAGSPERVPSLRTYALPPSQPAHSTETGSAANPESAYPSGSGYPPGPSFPAASGYVTPGHLASIRPSINQSNYSYEDEYTKPDPSHRQASTYPRGGSYRDPRDPRTLPSYPSYVSSPGDGLVHGAVDDPRAYDHISPILSPQSGRGGSFRRFGGVPHGYDPGESPRMRHGFRTEPRDTDIESRDLRNQGNLESTGYPSMRAVTKRTRSADIAGSTEGPETVSRKRGRRPVQEVGGHTVESDGDTVPKFPSNEDVLQPPTEKSDATPDEESEWSGISSSDDDAVCQQFAILICQLSYFLYPSFSSTP